MDSIRRRNCRLMCGALVFCTVFFAYTLPIQDWCYWGDDYGFVYQGKKLGLTELVKFSFGAHGHLIGHASNTFPDTKPSFSEVPYRPLATILAGAHYQMFGVEHPYYAYLLTVAFFALSIMLIFYVFCLIVPNWLAAISALWCAFHSIFASWFGLMCMQPYLIGIGILAIILLLLREWHVRLRYQYLVLACVAFAILLLLHEIFVILPAWLLVASLAVYWPDTRGWLKRTITTSLPFFLVLALYVLVRAMLHHPAVICGSTDALRGYFFHRFVTGIKFLDFVPAFVETIGIGWLGNGHSLVKSATILACGLFWMFLFFKTSHKRVMLAVCSGAVFFAWPAIFIRYGTPYIYLSHFFLLASVLIGLRGMKRMQAMFAGVLLFMMIAGAMYNVRFVCVRGDKFVCADNAVRNAVASGLVSGKPILLVGTPAELIPSWGVAQALWLYSGDDSFPVYSDYCFNTCSFADSFGIQSANIPRENVVDVSCVGRKVRLISKDHNKIWFFGGKGDKCSLGSRVPLRQEMVGWDLRTYDVEITVDDKWWSDDLVVLTWDFATQQFKTVKRDQACSLT